MDMCRLRQQSTTLQQEAELPRRPPLNALRFIHDYRIQQATSSDSLHKGALEVANGGAELLPEVLSTLGKLLVNKDIQGCHRDSATEGVPTVSAAMLTGLDAEHHVAVGKDSGHRVNYEELVA